MPAKYATTEQVNRVEEKVDLILTNHLPAMSEKIGCLNGKVKTLFWIIPVAISLASLFVGLLLKFWG